MVRIKTNFNEEKLNKYIQEGRGQGEGGNYKPWKNIRDFPSMGRCSRILGWKTNRVHHLISDIQTRFFYLMDWEDDVIDIRESYPLLDLNEVIEEENDLRFDLFKDKESATPYILTTSFLITIKENGKNRYVARSIKAISELEKKITIEKYEIEKRYWLKKQINWGIVTQKEIPVLKAKNIEWVHSALYSVEERGLSEIEVNDMSIILIESFLNSNITIRRIISKLDKDYNLQDGTSLFLFKYLIATKRIKVDMNKEININDIPSNIILEFDNGMEMKKIVSG